MLGVKEKNEAINLESLSSDELKEYRKLRRKLNAASSIREADSIYHQIMNLLNKRQVG